MKTPFTSKGDMVSELQTAQHYIETLVHHSYDIGFTEGCRYCEKVIYDRVLEIIDYYEEQCTKAEGTWLEMVRKDVLDLKGGEQG